MYCESIITSIGDDCVIILVAKQSDLDYVRVNPLYKSDKVAFPLTGTAYTARVNGKIIAIGGAIVFWTGVAEVWMILSIHAGEFKTSVALCAKSILNRLIDELKLKRAQACVRMDFKEAADLVESLGFKCEGKMDNYLPDGTSAWLYAKIVGD